MFDLQNCNRISLFVLVPILIISLTTYTPLLRAGWSDIIGVSPEIESLANLKKYVEKLKKLKDKPDKKEAYKLTKKIKKEVENLSGKKVSVSKGFAEVESIFNKKGINVSHAQFKAIQEDLKHGGKQQGQEEEIDIPIHVTVGIVLTLCGVFLCVLPIPFSAKAGEALILFGSAMAGNELCNQYEENKKKDRDKNRN